MKFLDSRDSFSPKKSCLTMTLVVFHWILWIDSLPLCWQRRSSASATFHLIVDSNVRWVHYFCCQINFGGAFSSFLRLHFPKIVFQSWYRESPDSTVFMPQGNRTIAKTVLIGDWFRIKVAIYDLWISKVPFLPSFCLANKYFFPWIILIFFK